MIQSNLSSSQPINPSLFSRPREVVSEESAHKRKLAARAKERRVAIGMKCPELCRLTGMAPSMLSRLERVLSPGVSPDVLAKWEDALIVPRGWLFDTSLQAFEVKGESGQECDLPSCSTAAEEIHAIASWLANPNRNRRSFVHYPLGKTERRSAAMFAQRYGVKGPEKSSLQAIGDDYGVTRERVRQVVAQLMSRARGLVVKTPRINEVLSSYQQYVPSSVRDVDQKLADKLGENLSLWDLSSFVREVLGMEGVSFGREPKALGEGIDAHYVSLPGLGNDFLATLRSCSLRMIRQSGAAQILVITGAVSQELGRPVSVSEIEKGLKVTSGFEWLLEEDGWYWLGQHTDNRLVTVARKLLVSSQSPLDTHDVAAALSRNRREGCEERKKGAYAIEPPALVVGQVLSRHEEFRVFQYSFVELRTPVVIETVLPDAEAKLVRYVQEQGGVASRVAMTRDLVDTGIVKEPTLHAVLATAPSFCRLERGIFCIAGQRIAPDALRRAQQETGDRVGRRSMVAGPFEGDGFVSVRCTVKQVMLGSTFVAAPVVIGKFIEEGFYSIEGSNKKLRCKANQFEAMRIYGLPGVLIERRMGVGTEFILSVNPETRTFRIMNSQSGGGYE